MGSVMTTDSNYDGGTMEEKESVCTMDLPLQFEGEQTWMMGQRLYLGQHRKGVRMPELRPLFHIT